MTFTRRPNASLWLWSVKHPYRRFLVQSLFARRGPANPGQTGQTGHPLFMPCGYTPKHGSWLNMAEIELSILSRQCLDRRIPDQDTLKKEVAAWQAARNALGSPMEWRFTTEDVRVNLKKLYPTVLN
ncbi:MAG: hypothetical protein EPN89_11535 [Methylovulum sp.]|nr:MAG: hypothetical protein EPN89_11535 [Methylovulum sp.]